MIQNPAIRSCEIFVVPSEVFKLLDPIEQIVIRKQAERGEIKILTEPSGVTP